MKKIILLFLLISFSCQSPYGKVSTDDDKSQMIKTLFQNVSKENIDYLKEIFSDDMEFIDSKENTLDKDGFIAGVENIFDLFDDITFEETDGDATGSEIETTTYENGIVWTNIWNTFSATGKYTGQKVSFPFHISYQWKDDKIIKEVQFFDSSIFEKEMDAKAGINHTATKVIGLAELIVNKGFNKKDVESFMVRFTKFVRDTEPNTYDFGYFISSNGKRVNLVEKYYDSEDFVHHLNNFESSEFAQEFMTLFTLDKVIISGASSEALKAKAKAYGAELRSQVGGWIN